MPFLLNCHGNPVPPYDFGKQPDWVRDRIEAAGIDPKMVYAVSRNTGALGETYIAKIDIGYFEAGDMSRSDGLGG